MSERSRGTRTLEERLLAELPRVREFVRKLVRGSSLASEVDDIAQEVAARALRYRGAFDVERDLGPWLRKTALRVFLDRRDRARRERSVDDDGEAVDRAKTFDATLADRDELARVLAKLAPVEREVLTRFHARGESVREIAAALRMPEGTVKSHLHRARRKLAGDAP